MALIIARADADMDDVLAELRRKRLEEFGVERRAAVVDAACRIEGDDQVLVEHHRVGAGQPMGAVARRRGPRRRPKKDLARDDGIGGFDRRTVDADDRQHLARVGPPHHGDLFAGEGAGVGFGRGREGAAGCILSSSGEPADADSPGSRRPESPISCLMAMTIDKR